jgi:hypothetical protein
MEFAFNRPLRLMTPTEDKHWSHLACKH